VSIACLAPTGAIRIAVAVGPAKSAVWTRIPDGGTEPEGVTVDLARALGALAGLPVTLVPLSSSAEIIATADDGIWDVSFAPIDPSRRAAVDVGTAFHLGESSYLVREDSAFRRAGDLHRPGVVILGVAGTATLRGAGKAAAGATLVAAPDLVAARASFEAGEGDALALGRLALEDMARTMPGTRVTEGNFHVAETAVIVPKGREGALAAASDLVRRLKADGTVKASFLRHGMPDAVIPPDP
jgi:polar amino acid transport system substrate-binding protein